jgi:hypothetical protein
MLWWFLGNLYRCIIDEGLTQQCGVSNVGECQYGTSTCSAGTWGLCQGNIDPINETCDSKDNDCDGVTDEGCECINGEVRQCGTDVGECMLGNQTCTTGSWGACLGEIGPSTEICDGKDNDCNGEVDEGVCPYCGDASCNGAETCATCPGDCGACPIPDFCNDTDGGWVLDVKGIVNGYLNNQPYSNTDYCTNNVTVVEYYCSGNRAYQSTVPCLNLTYYCWDGACA